MKAFWREEPLTAGEERLLQAVLEAHDRSARRQNVSANAVAIGAIAANDYGKAIAGAILTLGGLHGPIAKVMELLESDCARDYVTGLLCEKRKVPGWGNSFHRGRPDPEWVQVDELLANSRWWLKMAVVTETLRKAGKILFPNPAAYTAAAALALGMPAAIAPYLFLHGRLAAWSEIYLEHHLTNLWE